MYYKEIVGTKLKSVKQFQERISHNVKNSKEFLKFRSKEKKKIFWARYLTKRYLYKR